MSRRFLSAIIRGLIPLLLVLVLPLAACSNGAAQRKALAQCKMQREARASDGWNLSFLETCMQAKGYAVDTSLVAGGTGCSTIPYPAAWPECYRPDTWWSEQRSKWRHKAG